MSVSVEADVSSPLSDGQSILDPTTSKSSTDSQSSKIEDIGAGHDDRSEPTTPKPHPMAFTIDFGSAKPFDNKRLEELAKKSQARHQRVQSMSASFTRTSPASQRPPMSAKLPRKAQGYNSEGYFSSDQEDSGLSNSIKHRAQNITSPGSNMHIQSPVTDNFQPKRTSKSPIVDSIMSRSDNFTLNPRYGLNLPLRSNSYMKDVAYQPKTIVDMIDQSPEVMLTDISSPELDILTPDNGLSTPELKSPSHKSRTSMQTPDLFKKCVANEPLYVDDDIDRQSNSSAGTYTIEGDNYTEEQKVRMSIDRNFANASAKSVLKDQDPELVFDYSKCVITKEPRRDIALRSPLTSNKAFEIPKVSNDKNVLEISCCYESPTENDLAAQTSKQIKSTRSYLEKIKNRVRTITEKTFAKPPLKVDLEEDVDVGSFTSVTTSGVLSSKAPLKVIIPFRRRCSLTKSEMDQTDYVHRIARESSVPVDYIQRLTRDSSVEYLQRLSRESSVPVSLPSTKSPFDDAKFESTALRKVQKAMRHDSGDTASYQNEESPEQMVGKLSHLSINRCKGDKAWIQDWADSVKKYNNVLGQDDVEDRPPLSPRNLPGRSKSCLFIFVYNLKFVNLYPK